MENSRIQNGYIERSVCLEWSEHLAPNRECSYNHTIAQTPFGRFLLTWKGWKYSTEYGFDETPWGEIEYHGWFTFEEAQEWAAQEMQRRIGDCFKDNTKN